MPKSLTASTIKSWFQYRCERKVRYELFDEQELAALPIEKKVQKAAWAEFGDKFEDRVILALAGTDPVLKPVPGGRNLTETQSRAFLSGQKSESYAYQLNLRPNSLPEFLSDSGIILARLFPDLVRCERVEGRLRFTMIDIKAARKATPYHKAQIAFYVHVLKSYLSDLNVPADINPKGEVWLISDAGTASGSECKVEVFVLEPYLRLVDDFCRNELPKISAKEVTSSNDETFFHIYFKCEQCAFLAHCARSIDERRPAKYRDVSAVAGVTHEAKKILLRSERRTVGELATATGLAKAPGAGWSLSRRANLLVRRAQALISDKPLPTEETQTFLMPERADVRFLISVDYDPIDDRIAALGYKLVRNGVTRRELVKIPRSGRGADEADAMAEIFGPLIQDLSEIDAYNSNDASAGTPIYAHIFFYEPSEAVNLQRAVGRHLDDTRIRTGLLNLVRLFPPEDIVPEPEFRGMHHLPATPVRTVIEHLYALPVTVAYDLRQVSQVLAGASSAYYPQTGFERPFSSLLSVDVIRNFRDGHASAKPLTEIEGDVRSRLVALDATIEWLFQQNHIATSAGQPLFRLAKQPFKFHQTFDPLNAIDLDVLVACEILENRAGLLEALINLAQPAERRRDAGRCFANLAYRGATASGGEQVLRFEVPRESQNADLTSRNLDLILTDDSPNLRLNIGMWNTVKCRVIPERASSSPRYNEVRVAMNRRLFDDVTVQNMIRAGNPWFIDKSFVDFTSARAAAFLSDLGR